MNSVLNCELACLLMCATYTYMCVCVCVSGSEVEEEVMSVMRERIPLAATQPLTETRSVPSL